MVFMELAMAGQIIGGAAGAAVNSVNSVGELRKAYFESCSTLQNMQTEIDTQTFRQAKATEDISSITNNVKNLVKNQNNLRSTIRSHAENMKKGHVMVTIFMMVIVVVLFFKISGVIELINSFRTGKPYFNWYYDSREMFYNAQSSLQ